MKKILVVDNHPLILEFMSNLLTREGYEVVTAEDGLTALDILQTFTPEIIFIDLIMPNIDGRKLCGILRRIPECKDAYIVILSGIATEEEIDFEALGANACIAKGPFNKMTESILLVLERLHGSLSPSPSDAILGWRHSSPWMITRELLSIKSHFEVILETMLEGIIETAGKGRIIYANRTAKALIELPEEEILGMSFVSLFRESDRDTVRECIESLENTPKILSGDSLVMLSGKQVSLKLLPIPNKAGAAIIILNDITQQKQMEAQLEQARKMEAVGVLAGGIAHDFNNILTAVIGNISLGKLCTPQGSNVMDRLDAAEKAALRAKSLTQQLLTFAKGGSPVKRLLYLPECIEENTKLAVRGSNVRCEFNLAEDTWPVEADEGQIAQVVSNLVINAGQAMPEGGNLAISSKNVIFDRPPFPSLPAGKYVKISFQDNGIGIAAENLPKIFDPYFSTRGVGSGFGLATAYSIIRRHGGHITVDSEYGSGTTFHIFLPASERSLKRSEQPGLPAGKGRVLVMDDDETVREVLGKMLGFIGYDVCFASDGNEAIKVYQEELENHHAFDAVILDLTIPGGMGGKETIHQLLNIDRNVKAIVCSGYSNDPILSEYHEFGFKGVITKPCMIQELSQVLREVTENG